MIRFYLQGIQVQKWVGDGASNSSLRKFIMANGHEITATHLCDFDDDTDVEFTDVKLCDIPAGQYNGFDAKWNTIGVAVTPTHVWWAGQVIWYTVDKRFIHVKEDIVDTMKALLEKVQNRHVRVYVQSGVLSVLPGRVYGTDMLRFNVHLNGDDVTAHDQHFLIGTLDLEKGVVIPWPGQ